MKSQTATDIKIIQAELRKCQAQMKRVSCQTQYAMLFETSRALNLKLADLARRSG